MAFFRLYVRRIRASFTGEIARFPTTEKGIEMKVKTFAVACLLAVSFTGAAKAQSGIASVYAYSGGKTASGERANPGGLTAAHRSLPFGTRVVVTNRKNGKSVVVRINDRGPFVRGHVIDVTPVAARALGFSGLASVSLSQL
jgi:rare lipoprotein A